MIIAVNTRFLLKGQLEGCGYFIQEAFGLLARNHPEHQFYFLFDRPFSPDLDLPSNVHPLVVGPPARTPLLWKYWYDFRVPRVLKKIRADVFVSPDGYASLSTSVRQCLVVHDLGFLHHPEAYRKKHLRYLRRNMPRFVKKAAAIATVSQFSKQDIQSHYRVAPEKIRVVYNGVRTLFQPLPEAERAQVREAQAGGQAYFIYVGALQPRKNLVNLLKAFSVFKKRQQSGMKLILAGRVAWKNEELLALLSTYKYRADVVLTHYVEEQLLARLLASAYALVYPSFFEGFGVPVLEAMRCGVPVLTSKDTAMQEVAGSAGLYFDPHNHQDMAEQLMRIYKDEALHARMSEEGHLRAEQYSWPRTAELLWESIEDAKNNK